MDPNANSDAFYAGALTRISNSMIVLAVLFTGGSWILYGGRIAVGLAWMRHRLRELLLAEAGCDCIGGPRY